MTEKESRELELKKHVGSIHCSNTLSLLQRKISNVLLYHAYDELLKKEEHEIAIKSLCQLIGYSSHDYDSIKRALKALISTVLEWNLLGDNKTPHEEDWNASSILASVGIKGGICTYSYSVRLKKLLYMPEIYGRVNIAIQSRFKSNYALALYENCVRYQNLPYTRWFPLGTFRKLMGVPETKYIIFRDFKRRVLDKSVEEVNAFSDIVVQPEIEREGPKVSRIRFKLDQRKAPESPSRVPTERQEQGGTENFIMEKLTQDFGLSIIQAQKIVKQYDSEFIREKINLIEGSNTFKASKVHNLAAYFRSALKEDYQYKRPKKIPDQELLLVHENQQELLLKKYYDYVGVKIDQMFCSLEIEIQNKLKKEFVNYLTKNKNSFVLDRFYKKGFSDLIVRSMFRAFLKEQFADLLPNIESFEQFSKSIQ